MSGLLSEIETWCAAASLPAHRSDDDTILITSKVNTAIRVSVSVDRLWLQQRVDVPAGTTDAEAITAARIVNHVRRGVLEVRWRVGYAEITGSLPVHDCTQDAVLLLFDRATEMHSLFLRQLRD